MDRRSFFRSMIGGVAATAAVRTFPFRVFSFPSQPIIPKITTFAQARQRLFELACPPGVPQRFLVFQPNSAVLLVNIAEADTSDYNPINVNVIKGIDWDCDFETGIVTVSP